MGIKLRALGGDFTTTRTDYLRLYRDAIEFSPVFSYWTIVPRPDGRSVHPHKSGVRARLIALLGTLA